MLFHAHTASPARERRLLRFADPEVKAGPELPPAALAIVKDIDALAAKMKEGKKFADLTDDRRAIEAALKLLIGDADKNEQPRLIAGLTAAAKDRGLLLTVAPDKVRGGSIVILTPLVPEKGPVAPKDAIKKVDPAEPVNKFEKDTLFPLIGDVDRVKLASFLVKFRTFTKLEGADFVETMEPFKKFKPEKKGEFLVGYVALGASDRQVMRLALRMSPTGWTEDDLAVLPQYYVLHSKLSQNAKDLYYNNPHAFLDDPTMAAVKRPNAAQAEIKKFLAKIDEGKLMRVAFQIAIRSEFFGISNQFGNNLRNVPTLQMAQALQAANVQLLKDANANYAKRKAANPDYPSYKVEVPGGKILPELVPK